MSLWSHALVCLSVQDCGITLSYDFTVCFFSLCYIATKSPNEAAGASTLLPVTSPARTSVPVASLSSTAVFASIPLHPTSAHSSECPSCSISVPFLPVHQFIFSLSSPGAPLEGIRAWSFSSLASRCLPGLSWARETDPVSPVSCLLTGNRVLYLLPLEI